MLPSSSGAGTLATPRFNIEILGAKPRALHAVERDLPQRMHSDEVTKGAGCLRALSGRKCYCSRQDCSTLPSKRLSLSLSVDQLFVGPVANACMEGIKVRRILKDNVTCDWSWIRPLR